MRLCANTDIRKQIANQYFFDALLWYFVPKIQLEKSIDNITDNELMKEFLEITETYTAKFITQQSFSKEVESLLINTFGNIADALGVNVQNWVKLIDNV